jgi:hypothetical protein
MQLLNRNVIIIYMQKIISQYPRGRFLHAELWTAHTTTGKFSKFKEMVSRKFAMLLLVPLES